MDYEYSIERSRPNSKGEAFADLLTGMRWRWKAQNHYDFGHTDRFWLTTGFAYSQKGARRKALRAIMRQHGRTQRSGRREWPKPVRHSIKLDDWG